MHSFRCKLNIVQCFSGKQCTTKKLSKVLLKVFQLVSKTLKYHCQYNCKFQKTKSYWIIDNSDDIHRDIKQLNNKKKASTIYSYDFMKPLYQYSSWYAERQYSICDRRSI